MSTIERLYAMVKHPEGDGWLLPSNDGKTSIWLCWRDWDLADMGAEESCREVGWMVYTQPKKDWPPRDQWGNFDDGNFEWRDGPFKTRREAMQVALEITS